MATHRMSIFGGLKPDDTGRAFFTGYEVYATNDVFKHTILALLDPSSGQAHGVYGAFHVPKNYVGTPKIIIKSTSTGTTGNFKNDFDYRAVAVNESADQTTFQENLTATTATDGTANEYIEVSLTITAANLAVDDEVQFYLTREDGSSTDTVAAVQVIHDIFFEYADA